MMSSLPDKEQEIRPSQTQKNRCLYCGQYAELIWVHGHGQCSACGINTEECCRGESCSTDQ